MTGKVIPIKIPKKTFLALIPLLVLASFTAIINIDCENVKATTIVPGGSITMDTIWNISGSPYIITGDVTVVSGVSLTIEPGVEVKFDGYYSLIVHGSIYAIGTEGNRITITSNKGAPASTDWVRIEINSGAHAEIKYCDISYAWDGLYFWSSSNNIVSNCSFTNNFGSGIYLYTSSDNNIITNNYVSGSNFGIHLWLSSNNNISNNILSSNGYGIHLWKSSNIDIIGNNFTNDGVVLEGDLLQHFNSHTIPDNNIVNGKPLYYYKNVNGIDINGIPVGQIILANCNSFNIKNLQIDNTDAAIELAFSSNIQITNNYISKNKATGIFLAYLANNNNITNNNVTDNQGSSIMLFLSSNNNIISNNFSSNNLDGMYMVVASDNQIMKNIFFDNNLNGIRLQSSSNNVITKNIFHSNTISGIDLTSSDNNQITANNVSMNTNNGIKIKSSSNNQIYHNNILNNSNQASDDTNGNIWNATYPSGGNFWSDWSPTCNDLYNGTITPQTTGSPDGICDEQYDIDGDSSDFYPLKYPFLPSPDIEPPTIDGVIAVPDPQEVHDYVNISATVIDNEQLEGVWINITDPNNAILGNNSMDYDVINDCYYYNIKYDLLGIYQFTIFANDMSNNWNSSLGSFIIEDRIPPLISNVFPDPQYQEVLGEVNISAIITDNFELFEVWLNITHPNGSSTNSTIDEGANDIFYLIQSYGNPGTYNFTLWANDTSNNWNSSSGSFTIETGAPPSINNITINPNTQVIFHNVNISAEIIDDYNLYGVWLNISYPNGSSINISMNKGAQDVFYFNQSYNITGNYNFIIWTNDTSNYWNAKEGSFTIWDPTLPQSTAGVIPPYWKNILAFEVAWTASDNLGLSNITLLYRYSVDNSSWSPWIEYSSNNTISGTSASGSFLFTASNDGYYEFFTNASDMDNNWEPNATTPEAITAIDISPPSSSINPITLYWINSSPLILDAIASDSLSGIKDLTLWFRYSSDNITWNPWEIFETDSLEPWSWTFNFPSGEGYYEFYSVGKDNVINIESKSMKEVQCGYDTTLPIADAGENKMVTPYTMVYLDGTASRDNFGVISNYTWVITRDFIVITNLYDPNSSFEFDATGEYTVTLTIKDPSGNSDDDTIIVTVNPDFVDSEAPEISASVTPINPEVHNTVNITAEVTDNVEVFGVWIRIFDPLNNDLENISMNRIDFSDSYWYERPYTVVGNYNYTIKTNDTADNWAFTSGNFNVQDFTSPNANAGENLSINVSNTVYFDGSGSTDNVGITNYTWNIAKNGILIITLYSINPEYKFDENGSYGVTLIVKDAAGNIDSDIIMVSVTAPVIDSKEKDESDYLWLILLVIIIIIAIIVILLLIYKRKKPSDIVPEASDQES